MFEVDKKWLSTFVGTVRPEKNKTSVAEDQVAYASWKEIFDKECDDGVLNVLWSAYLVLATKK
jgi:hypothetical protein